MKKLLLLSCLFFFGLNVQCQQLTYQPTNPAFGGNYLNYSWMLASATAQNQLKAPGNQAQQESELDRLGKDINRQILTQISRSLLREQLDGFKFDEEGTFTFGSLSIEIYETLEGLVINILDTSTGEESQIVIPNN
ncbi:curli assembly protein CsgF [Salinimicrobium sp. MT39]|uniref:Curli production assembly/transport component CsgF n=1 Tax=Salinimicrobium profundisediminis TaxID=2994553 RepID=A0A9X3CWA5_9FLAO|nr:curli assembly protein CsgF [Salinimicrobium profundisediminis]MCX2837986.1 curli assembly protein CsgF [Salinimicrobium profundisediminis]